MKRSIKNTKESSAKVKARVKAGAKKKSLSSPELSKSAENESTPSTQQLPSKISSSNKLVEGAIKIDHLPLQSQMNVLFNPLQNYAYPEQVVGKVSDNEPAKPNFTTITSKKDK